MKVVHNSLELPVKEKAGKLSKNRKAIASGIIKWTLENNAKVRREQQKIN
jgi:hypothetical protein